MIILGLHITITLILTNPYIFQSLNQLIQVLIIGDASVGKSALLSRFSDDMFTSEGIATIGIDFNSRQIKVDESICKLELWDTAGQERFSTITANYYRNAQGALLVYDVGVRASFDAVKKWLDRAVQVST